MTMNTTLTIMGAKGAQAAQRIQGHPAFMSIEAFDTQFLYTDTPLLLSEFISQNGCLITCRHDSVNNNPGQDFLLNLMIEMLVLHVGPQGEYTVHYWEKGKLCAASNQIPKEKERDILDALFEAYDPLSLESNAS